MIFFLCASGKRKCVSATSGKRVLNFDAILVQQRPQRDGEQGRNYMKIIHKITLFLVTNAKNRSDR